MILPGPPVPGPTLPELDEEVGRNDRCVRFPEPYHQPYHLLKQTLTNPNLKSNYILTQAIILTYHIYGLNPNPCALIFSLFLGNDDTGSAVVPRGR